MDYSKGQAIHRLYGHAIFNIEALKKKKDARFIRSICSSIKCNGGVLTWRDHIRTEG